MEMYNHIKVDGSYLVSNITNRRVAVVTDGELAFMIGSGESEADVRDYCVRMGLCKEEQKHEEDKLVQRKKTYNYHVNDRTCIIKNIDNELVVIIEDDKFQFMGRGNEEDVKEFCKEHNLWPKCKGTYSHNTVEGCCVIKNERKQTVAMIQNAVFRFMPNSGANEADVRLYCQEKGLYQL